MNKNEEYSEFLAANFEKFILDPLCSPRTLLITTSQLSQLLTQVLAQLPKYLYDLPQLIIYLQATSEENTNTGNNYRIASLRIYSPHSEKVMMCFEAKIKMDITTTSTTRDTPDKLEICSLSDTDNQESPHAHAPEKNDKKDEITLTIISERPAEEVRKQSLTGQEGTYMLPVMPNVKKVIVIVDDDDLIIKLLSVWLKGYTVLTYCNGREVVEAFKNPDTDKPWSLIIMDFQMPELLGTEASKEIRRHETELGLPKTPIICVSAQSIDQATLDECEMDGLCAKPIVRSHFFSVLKCFQLPPIILPTATNVAPEVANIALEAPACSDIPELINTDLSEDSCENLFEDLRPFTL